MRISCNKERSLAAILPEISPKLIRIIRAVLSESGTAFIRVGDRWELFGPRGERSFVERDSSGKLHASSPRIQRLIDSIYQKQVSKPVSKPIFSRDKKMTEKVERRRKKRTPSESQRTSRRKGVGNRSEGTLGVRLMNFLRQRPNIEYSPGQIVELNPFCEYELNSIGNSLRNMADSSKIERRKNPMGQPGHKVFYCFKPKQEDQEAANG
jgi:hypothetical protein